MLQNIIQMVAVCLVFVVGYLVYRYIKKMNRERPMLVKGIKDATIPLELPRDTILEPQVGNEFTYSMWIKINDWGHNFSQPKHIFHVGDKEGNSVCPGVWLYPKNNNLMVRVDTHHRITNINKTISGKTCQNWLSQYPHKHPFEPSVYKTRGIGDHNYCRDPDGRYNGSGSWCYTTDKNTEWGKCSSTPYTQPSSMNPSKNPAEIDENKKCDIVDIPIQRWIHVLITLSNRTLDVFINGELSRSCTLENVPKANTGDIFINQNGGFNGAICDLQYVNFAISESNIKKIYSKGVSSGDLDLAKKGNEEECKKKNLFSGI